VGVSAFSCRREKVKMDEIQTSLNYPQINAPFQSISIGDVARTNLQDFSYFDNTQYIDKSSDSIKTSYTKYLHKESIFIHKMVTL
jgi:hypothetical protein